MSYGTKDNGRGGSPVAEPVASSSTADGPASPPTASPPTESTDSTDGEGAPRHWTEKFRQNLHGFYERNFGLFLVFSAQTFGSVMNTAAKLLTSSDSSNQFHALHIIFVRMLATTILGMLYMWYKGIPNFPLGPRNVFGLLVMRGTSGFIGLFGLYYSLSYLEISDATAISFLVPTWTAILCYIWLREPYRVQEASAGLISLVGVLLIARPAFLFGGTGPVTTPDDGNVTTTAFIVDGIQGGVPVAPPSSSQRTIAVLLSILGTFAAATSYSTIRVIGKRAHSLISVNYFATLATVGSALIIAIHPDLHFKLPKGTTQWVLLAVIGVAGFLLQFLLTEGLQREKGGRATNMTYFQMVLALIIERVIWGTTPAVLSLVGSVLIISAAIWLSLQKSKPNEVKERTAVVDEETSLLGPGRQQSEA
ncbi:putative transport protein [Rosellinia necatrix]|uniref:Putative transport protein n=1 Tax=Rosellinia necatrix TaxID=77044 RepID=A0A1W2TN92_ROSNE|nr:putative transport protein [Rosellinia necatrix]